jgi:pyrroloquinoline-quinone synthase
MVSNTLLHDFWSRVREVLARYDLLHHPFYRAWTAGQLTRAQIGYYGLQYVHHVAAFPAYLTALHSRLPDGEMRRSILATAADEEVSGIAHADLWRQFIEAMGSLSQDETAIVLPEVDHLVKTYTDFARSSSPASALGAFYAYESQVPRIAEEKLAGLKSFYGADDRGCEYFSLHMTADLHHARIWARLIDGAIAENPASAEEALAGVRGGACALWDALDGIENGRRHLTN